MTKHAKKSDHLQLVDQPKTTTVEIPLPLLGAFANIKRSFFDLCVDAGQHRCYPRPVEHGPVSCTRFCALKVDRGLTRV